MNEVVTDPAVIARLPKAGWAVKWHWFWFRWVWLAVKATVQRKPFFATWRGLGFMRMRIANAESISIGPVNIVRPMPWLRGPAEALHPEAFQ